MKKREKIKKYQSKGSANFKKGMEDGEKLFGK